TAAGNASAVMSGLPGMIVVASIRLPAPSGILHEGRADIPGSGWLQVAWPIRGSEAKTNHAACGWLAFTDAFCASANEQISGFPFPPGKPSAIRAPGASRPPCACTALCVRTIHPSATAHSPAPTSKRLVEAPQSRTDPSYEVIAGTRILKFLKNIGKNFDLFEILYLVNWFIIQVLLVFARKL